MIYKQGTRTETEGIYVMHNGVKLTITSVYGMGRLIWQLIRSCYGTGIWLPERPWLDNDLWKNDR